MTTNFKSAEELNWEFIKACHNSPACSGQQLPAPLFVELARKIQSNENEYELCSKLIALKQTGKAEWL
jgi:hypothetical protein